MIAKIAAVAALLAGACAHEEIIYQPAAVEPEMPAVPAYPLPANAAKGVVYVVSLGVERFTAAPEPQLHLRMAAENTNDPSRWAVEPNDQTVSVAGGPPQRPTYARASTGGSSLALAAGQRGELDLYYALPPSAGATTVTLSWKVQRGGETSSEATTFARVAVATPPGPDVADGYVYHPIWRPGLTFDYGVGWWWGPQITFTTWGYHPWFFGWYPRLYHRHRGPQRVHVPPPPPAHRPPSPPPGKSPRRG